MIPLLSIDTYNKNEKPIGMIRTSGVSIKLYIDKKDIPKGQWITVNASGILGGKAIVETRSIEDAIDSAKEKFMEELKKYPTATSVIGLKFDLASTMIQKDTFNPAIIATMSGTVIASK
jgi:hypothetical protein